jgi:hypothetical protein
MNPETHLPKVFDYTTPRPPKRTPQAFLFQLPPSQEKLLSFDSISCLFHNCVTPARTPYDHQQDKTHRLRDSNSRVAGTIFNYYIKANFYRPDFSYSHHFNFLPPSQSINQIICGERMTTIDEEKSSILVDGYNLTTLIDKY